MLLCVVQAKEQGSVPLRAFRLSSGGRLQDKPSGYQNATEDTNPHTKVCITTAVYAYLTARIEASLRAAPKY